MPLAFAGVVASLIATLTLIGDDRSTFGGAFVVDEFALLFKVFFLSVAAARAAWSRFRYFRDGRFYQGEFYFLLLTSFLGCLADAVVAGPADAVHLARARVRAGVRARRRSASRDPRSNEAGIKFFLFGVLSTGGDALRDEPDLRAHRAA